MEAELVRQAKLLFGESVTAPVAPMAELDTAADAPVDAGAEPAENTPAVLKLRMTARQQRRLWRHVESIEDFWETLDEIEPGAIARLASLAADRRWEVVFLTKRPEGAGRTAQLQTQ